MQTRKFLILGNIDYRLRPEIVYSSGFLNIFRNPSFKDIEALTLTELNTFKNRGLNEPSISDTH